MEIAPQKSKKQNPVILVLLILGILFLIILEQFLCNGNTTPAGAISDNPKYSQTVSATQTPPPILPEAAPVSRTVDPKDPYPELYTDSAVEPIADDSQKTIYLTFDDGPSEATPPLLKVLRETGVFATFFATGKGKTSRELLRQIHTDGHTIGVHTVTHDYEIIYRNLHSYLADFSRQYYEIWEATGQPPELFRFPGGSVNSFNRHNYRELISEMSRRGFIYHDWNVTSGDADGFETPHEQLDELLKQSQNKTKIVALLHDTKKNLQTDWVVREYILRMKEAGYRFKALDTSVEPIQFPLPQEP